MKVTDQMIFNVMQSEMNRLNSRLQELRQEAASGRKFNQPSDDPSAVRPIINYSKQIRDSQRYQKNMGMALNQLQTQDSHLDHVEDTLLRARQTTLYAANGSLNENDLKILADQVGHLRKELLDTANARVNEHYIFAGYEVETKPFVENEHGMVSYQGDDNARKVNIVPGEKLEIAVTGINLFPPPTEPAGDGGPDIFNTLSRIEGMIRSGEIDGLNEEMKKLDDSMSRIRILRGNMGTATNRVQTSIENQEQAENDLHRILSRYQDADIVKTYSQLIQQETALRAAYNVSARISEISILDYM